MVRYGSLLLVLGTLVAAPAPATAAAPSNTPDAGAWVPDRSGQVAIRRGGTTWLGGSFEWFGPWTGSAAGVNVGTGAVDSDFPVVSGGEIDAVVPDTLGGAYIGGSFTAVGGMARTYLAHINLNGTLDPTFAPTPDRPVSALALAPDGSALYVGGGFTTINGQSRPTLAALAPFGGAVKSWSSCTSYDNPPIGDSASVSALAVSADSATVYAGGLFTGTGSGATCDGSARANIGAFSAATAAPTTFTANTDGDVLALALSGTNLYVGGKFNSLGANHLTRGSLGAVATTTGNATAFNPAPDSYVYTLATSGSTIYAGGLFGKIGTNAASRAGVAALTTAGLATAFDAHLAVDPVLNYVLVRALAVTTAPARVLVGGVLATPAGSAEVAALDATTGAADAVFNPRPGGSVQAIAATEPGHAFIGGQFNSVGAIARTGIVQLDAFGHPTSFALAGHRQDVTAMVLSADGSTLYALGFFDGAFTPVTAAFSTATGAELAWKPTVTGGQLSSISVSSTGDAVYLGGNFTAVDGAPRAGIAAVTASGTGTILPWRPDADGQVQALAVSPDGATVYAGGTFSHIGTSVAPRPFLAALSAASGDVTGWNPAPDGSVTAITPTRDAAHVYVGGTFTHIGTSVAARTGIADLTTASGNATPFHGEVDDYGPGSIAVPADESTIYAGGYYRKAFGYDTWGIAAFDGANGSDLGWSPGLDHHNHVVSVDVADSTVVLGGWFVTAGPDNRPYFAQYSAVPVNATAPALTAGPQAATAVGCAPGTWRNGPQIAVAWLLDGTAIGGATARSYTPAASDVGHALACRETGANPAGSAAATSTAATIAAASGPGPGPGSSPPPPPPNPPVLKALTLKVKLGKHSRKKIAATLTLSATAKVKATLVLLPRKKTGRARTIARFTWARKAGKSAASLARSKHRRFPAGHYRLTFVATDSARRTSAPARVVLTLKPR
ncbi:MAG: hypothetical protein QOG68_2759 [Solirubrobacteraceae bacterium]|nr:hypothetical protein [Solirubrobacteraceae bacterium]